MRTIDFLVFCGTLSAGSIPFWAPADPPRASYSIEASISDDGARLTGSERVRFRNDTSRGIGRVAFQFSGTDLH
jgi:hypothetical protein